MRRFESFFKSTVCSCALFACVVFSSSSVKADDGYRLWLRYDQIPTRIKSIEVEGKSATFDVIRGELSRIVDPKGDVSLVVRKLNSLKGLGPEGFRIRSVGNAVVITAGSEIGALYGTYHFLRLLQTNNTIARLQVDESPRLKLRLLNHWDNLDRSIERGYAGNSLWKWDELPRHVDPRLVDYARANASIGVNGTVLNNVNANSKILTREYLDKVAAIANVFRPYGIRVYLSARFSSPIELGNLPTADPLDPAVIEWWKQKADEIYKLIPDFGGFLVKANSEGQPGPRTYNRTHADGANMLAAAVAPHRGIVMWRAFVYDMKPGYDRAGAASDTFSRSTASLRRTCCCKLRTGQ